MNRLATDTRREMPPGAASAHVGMVGAGQLARMTHQAAVDLAVRLEVLARRPDDPAVLAGAAYCIGEPDDFEALSRLAREVAVVTLDHELVPNRLLAALAEAGHCLRPAPASVLFAQDKLHARRALRRLGFPVPDVAELHELADVERFAAEQGWPVVLKVPTGGYDGRGVRVAEDAAEAAAVVGGGGAWFVEAHVPIARELAVLVSRRPAGETAVYPLVETIQREGVCREVLMPARVDELTAARARDLGQRIVEAIDAAGVVAVELFLTPDDELVVNELSLRPHNSGHVTIEACATSQFHNHLRAVLDWPLGDVGMRAPAAAMANVLGSGEGMRPSQRLPAALQVPGAHVHLYGKQAHPGRKIGHVTVLADTLDQARANAVEAARRLVSA